MRKRSPLFVFAAALLTTLCTTTQAAEATASAPAGAGAVDLERIDPLFRPYVASMQGDYSSAEAVAKANERFAPAMHFGNITPELIQVKNAQDGTELEVSIYKPQSCSENTPKCPVFAYETQYDKVGAGDSNLGSGV